MTKAAFVEDARGMRQDDRTRPGDLVVMDFVEGGRHLTIDGWSGDYSISEYSLTEGGDYTGVHGETG